MAKVVMADDGIAFDGATAEQGPLGGAETAFVALAEALALRGVIKMSAGRHWRARFQASAISLLAIADTG